MKLNNGKNVLKKLMYFQALLLFGLTSGCISVKPYQNQFLNEREMQLTRSKIEYFQTSFQEYREGSSGGSSGVSSAGCGCN